MISERITLKFLTQVLLSGISLFLGTLFFSSPALSQAKSVEFVELDGVIDPVSSRFLLRQIEQAEQRGSNAVIVRIDTLGGLDISVRDVVQKILNSDVPIVVWVSPQGALTESAGVFIVYASHVAVMAPATRLGAAHPPNLSRGAGEAKTQNAVNVSDSYLRTIAIERGRSLNFAEAAVRQSASIRAEQAVEDGVVDLVVADLRNLLDQVNGRVVQVNGEEVIVDLEGASVRFHRMGYFEGLLHSVLRPEVAYLLLLFGLYGLIFELYHPGVGLAGVLGGGALVLSFYALGVLPTSWLGVALIALGVAFFVADLRVSGLGLFTVGGVVALIAGSTLLFAGADPSLQLGWWVIAIAVVASLIFFISVMTTVMRTRALRPAPGAEALVGTFGIARSDIAPEGQIHANGTNWRARTAGMAIGEGAPVKILGVSGLSVMVEEARPEDVPES
jgi:membrane-bound serine protease (ClpP class)